MSTKRRKPAGMTQHGPCRALSREAQAPACFQAPNLGKLIPGDQEEGEVLEEKQQASVSERRPPDRTAGLQGTAPRTLEARRIAPGSARQRTLLKGKGGEAALGSRSGSRAPPRKENKGAKRLSRQHPRRPHQGLESRSRPVARHPDLGSPGLALPTAQSPPNSPSLKLLPGLVFPNRSSPVPNRPRAEPGPAAALEFLGSRRPRRSSPAGDTGKAALRPSPSSVGSW